MNDIILSGISVSFGENRVLSDFSATFKAGKTTCVMGASGCGKTTLANVILGILRPDKGTVSGAPERLAAVFQEDRLVGTLCADKNIRAAVPHSTKTERSDILSAIGIDPESQKPASEMSGGQQRRVAIARALAANAELIVMDEPFKGLDDETRARVMAFVREHTRGRTLILITHDTSETEFFGGDIIKM